MNQLTDLISGTRKTVQEILHDFIESQKQNWPLAATNFRGLEKVKERSFSIGQHQIRAQFNPERMSSSVAETDKKSIAARKCFLCNDNRPSEQGEIAFGDDFLILVNPFPIFKNHFTITANKHSDQRFIANAKVFLELAEALKGFTVFYNGPECGASAPDHLHFQAGESSFMPITYEYDKIKPSGHLIFSNNNTQVWAFDNYLRKMISVETNSLSEGISAIEVYFSHFTSMQPEKPEPMMNALCSWTNQKWIVHLFPREEHRPSHFYETGEKQILISPGSVDFGGVFVLPRLEDFEKINEDEIVDILKQVSMSDDTFDELVSRIENSLNADIQ